MEIVKKNIAEFWWATDLPITSLRVISGTSTVQLLSNIPLRENVCLGARLRVELSIVLLRRLLVFNSSWDLRYSRNFCISLRDLNSNGNGSFTPVH